MLKVQISINLFIYLVFRLFFFHFRMKYFSPEIHREITGLIYLSRGSSHVPFSSHREFTGKSPGENK